MSAVPGGSLPPAGVLDAASCFASYDEALRPSYTTMANQLLNHLKGNDHGNNRTLDDQRRECSAYGRSDHMVRRLFYRQARTSAAEYIYAAIDPPGLRFGDSSASRYTAICPSCC